MTNTWKVRCNNQTAGSVLLKQEGAFYRYLAECALEENRVHRLVLRSGEDTIPLHLFVPKGHKMISTGRFPSKLLAEHEISFSAVAETKEIGCIPIATGGTFAYLDQLDRAVFVMTRSGPGLHILCDQKDTDHPQTE